MADCKTSARNTTFWDWVLRNVSFRVEPGETVAVVGHTGCIGRIDVRELDLQDLRRSFGVVLQDPHCQPTRFCR